MANRNRPNFLEIDWKELYATDHIPYKWFKHDVDGVDKCYKITNLRGERGIQAKCKIRVLGNQATLDYGGSNKEYNESKDIHIGTTRVTFHDESRIGVHKIKWEWEDEPDLEDFELDPGDWREI